MDPTLNYHPAPPKEAGRTLHCIDPEGFETVERRPARRGDLFADDSGPAAWIFRATSNHHVPTRIVRATAAPSFP